MRISVREDSPFYSRLSQNHVDTFLDGEPLLGVIEASEENGWALCLAGLDGAVRRRVDDGHQLVAATVVLHGRVEIRPKPEYLAQVRAAQDRQLDALRRVIAEVEAGRMLVLDTQITGAYAPARPAESDVWERVELTPRLIFQLDVYRLDASFPAPLTPALGRPNE